MQMAQTIYRTASTNRSMNFDRKTIGSFYNQSVDLDYSKPVGKEISVSQ